MLLVVPLRRRCYVAYSSDSGIQNDGFALRVSLTGGAMGIATSGIGNKASATDRVRCSLQFTSSLHHFTHRAGLEMAIIWLLFALAVAEPTYAAGDRKCNA